METQKLKIKKSQPILPLELKTSQPVIFIFFMSSKTLLIIRLDIESTFHVCVSRLFFLIIRSVFMTFLVGLVHYLQTYKSIFSPKLLLKMSPTTLFTYLKIILLQFFNF